MDQRLKTLREAGETNRNIAVCLSVSTEALCNRTQKLLLNGFLLPIAKEERSRRGGLRSWSKRAGAWTMVEDEQLLDMHAAGEASAEIAKTLNRTSASVNVRISKAYKNGLLQRLPKEQVYTHRKKGIAARSVSEETAAENRLACSRGTAALGYVVGTLFGDGFLSIGGLTHKGRSGTIGLKTRNRSFAEAFQHRLADVSRKEISLTQRTQHKKCLGRNYNNVVYFEVLLHDLHLAKRIWGTYGPTTTFAWGVDVSQFLQEGPLFCNAFLRGLFDSDGYVSKKGNKIEITTGNTEGLTAVLELCTALGYPFSLSPNGKKKKGSRLRLSDRAAAAHFAQHVGSDVDYKATRFEEIVAGF